MLPLQLSPLFELAKEIGRLSELSKTFSADHSPEVIKNNTTVIQNHASAFDRLGFAMCKLHCDRIIINMRQPTYTNVDWGKDLQELYNRLVDECNIVCFLVIDKSMNEFFEQKRPLFGDKVATKFPELAGDISEAGKCIALKRPTAAVFHLMRVMEGGVQKFGTALGVPLANELVWQVILDQANKQIKALGKAQGAAKKAEVAGNLYNVKLAWRNETMHPKATYTDEEADSIFRAVCAFMRELADVV